MNELPMMKIAALDCAKDRKNQDNEVKHMDTTNTRRNAIHRDKQGKMSTNPTQPEP